MSTEPTRRYEIEEPPHWHKTPRYTLRVYGRGTCTLGEGRPCLYGALGPAQTAGERWVSDGIAPADQ